METDRELCNVVALDVELVHVDTVTERFGHAAESVVAQSESRQRLEVAYRLGDVEQLIVLQVQRVHLYTVPHF